MINCNSGEKLGFVIDLEFDTSTVCDLLSACSKGRKADPMFRKGTGVPDPYKRIVKIGRDTVLVDIIEKDCLK